MQRIFKSLFTILTVFCFMASAAFAAPKDELEAVCKDMNKVNNGKIDFEITGKFLDDTYNVLAKLDFESKPLTLIRGETEVIVFEKGDVKKPKKTAYEFYVEDNDKEYTYYYTEKGKNKWYKDSVSNDDKKTEKDAMEVAVNKMDSQTLEDLTSKVEYDEDYMSIIGRGDNAGYKVTVDVPKFIDVVATVALEGATKEDAANIEAFREFGKELPSIAYTVVCDTKKREVKAVHMPLTDFLRGSGKAVVSNDKLDPMMKALAVMALSGAELDIKAEGKDYNKVKVEKLPENIKKNAKQVEKKKESGKK